MKGGAVARLAYCTTCKATFPLAIVASDGGRAQKEKVLTCPFGHRKVREVEKIPDGEPKKRKK